VFHGDEDIGSAFPDGDRLRHVCSPHFIDLVEAPRRKAWKKEPSPIWPQGRLKSDMDVW
jgi:hypothetical protein